VRFMPPLTITDDQVREALAIVGDAIRHVEEHGV